MRTGYLSFAIVTLMLAANLPAAADDSGHWRGLAALVVTDQKTVKVDDGTDHVVIVSEQDGAIQNADGNSFLDKARYQVVSVVDTGVIRGGYKTFTEADGSKDQERLGWQGRDCRNNDREATREVIAVARDELLVGP